MYWVDINLALKKGLKFYQTLSNAIILHESLPAYCIPKVVRVESGEVIYEKVYASPRLPPKTSLKHDWMKELGSEIARQPAREVVRQAKSSQLTQPNPNHDRTGTPGVCSPRALRSQEIETRFSGKEDVNHDGTGRPVVCSQRASHQRFSRESQNPILEEDANHDGTVRPVVCSQSERSMLNEVDIDFGISGLPHSVVEQSENYRVRELVKQIENHPHLQALQQDLQQNNAQNPFCKKSKKMIKDMDNGELFEFFETDPKTQCTECLLYWSQDIVYCTCGHLLKESEDSRGDIQCTLDHLSNLSLRRDDLMATDMGKLQNKEKILLPII